MAKTKQPETFLVTYNRYESDTFNPPCKHYIRIADGSYLFIKGTRKTVEKYIKEEYGDKYKVRTIGAF